MKKIVAAVALGLIGATPCSAAWDRVTPYLAAQYFTWEEHDAGRRLLKERGPRVAVGVVADQLAGPRASLRGRGELFGGQVDYRGETQAPDSVPVSTEVDYFGVRGELDLGYRIPVAAYRFEPFVGVGYQWWLRTLQDTATADGSPVSGYTERWRNVYARAGARGEAALFDEATLVAEAGIRYPVYVSNSIEFVESGTVTFRPGGLPSGFAEAGVHYRRLKLSLSYEASRFSQSPLKLVQSRYFFQPDSSGDLFGVSLGWSF